MGVLNDRELNVHWVGLPCPLTLYLICRSVPTAFSLFLLPWLPSLLQATCTRIYIQLYLHIYSSPNLIKGGQKNSWLSCAAIKDSSCQGEPHSGHRIFFLFFFFFKINREITFLNKKGQETGSKSM